MASLSVAWGILAGIAYLGLVKRAVDYATSRTPWPGFNVDGGLIAIHSAPHLAASYRPLFNAALIVVPVAAVAIIALGIAARIRPSLQLFSIAELVAALLGLISASGIFAIEVVTVQNGTQIGVALATIVLVAVLLRLQRFIRHFYRRAPAAATLLFAAVTLTYLILSNGTNLSSIVLSQVHIWLAVIAFLIATYAAIVQVRAGGRLTRSAAKTVPAR
jgi:hypothetical protein